MPSMLFEFDTSVLHYGFRNKLDTWTSVTIQDNPRINPDCQRVPSGPPVNANKAEKQKAEA